MFIVLCMRFTDALLPFALIINLKLQSVSNQQTDYSSRIEENPSKLRIVLVLLLKLIAKKYFFFSNFAIV